MKIEPLSDYVVIRQLEEHHMGPGGIVIPKTAQQDSNQGEVLAVGPGRVLESGETLEPHVRSGDNVLFESGNVTQVNLDHEELLVVHESDIIGKIVD